MGSYNNATKKSKGQMEKRILTVFEIISIFHNIVFDKEIYSPWILFYGHRLIFVVLF